MSLRRIQAGAAPIAYTDRGSGVPILLMHGNPDSRHSWGPVIDRLGPGVRAIAPDFPGFGDSEPLPDGADLLPRGMVELWDRFIDGLAIELPIIVAVHDFGGPWLLPWVASHPERVGGVLMLNTLFRRDYRWHLYARLWQRRGLGELSMRLLNRPQFRLEMRRGSPHLSRELIDATYARIHPTMKRTVLRVYRAYADPARAFADWDGRLLDALSGIPTRVIWGDRDPYIGPEFADGWGVPAEHLHDYGHWHHMSNPDGVAKALQALAERGGPLGC